MKHLSLTNSDKVLLVDDEDFERLSDIDWYLNNGNPYMSKRVNFKLISIAMPNVILRRLGIRFDHADRNPLNNQKNNLREATRSQNGANRVKFGKTSSKYKGVSWEKAKNKWRAYIKFNYKSICLGFFDKEEDAALAYNKKAIELFKEFCCLNKISSSCDGES